MLMQQSARSHEGHFCIMVVKKEDFYGCNSKMIRPTNIFICDYFTGRQRYLLIEHAWSCEMRLKLTLSFSSFNAMTTHSKFVTRLWCHSLVFLSVSSGLLGARYSFLICALSQQFLLPVEHKRANTNSMSVNT